MAPGVLPLGKLKRGYSYDKEFNFAEAGQHTRQATTDNGQCRVVPTLLAMKIEIALKSRDFMILQFGCMKGVT